MIFPANSQEIARRLNAYLPLFARPLLGRLIERVRFETQEEIALAQEARRREEITQNVLGEAGEITPQIAAAAASMAAAWLTGTAAPPRPGEPLPPQAAAFASFIAEHAAAAADVEIRKVRRFHAGKPGGLEELRDRFGPYFDRIVDVDAWVSAVRRGEDPSPYMLPAEPAPPSSADVDTDRILFITQHLAGPHPDPADLEDQQRAREELIQAAEQAD